MPIPKIRLTTERVTIKDVARHAGVSVSTVSNVLNGRTSTMTPETLHRIRQAIHSLNYRPSSVARGLVTRRTATVGIILSEIETPLFLQALSFIEPIARDAGYNLLLCKARSLNDEREAVELLRDKQVDGIIFLSISEYRDDEHLLELQASGLPLVLVNRAIIHATLDQINWDNVNGVMAAVEHLVQQGHQRIAHLRGPMNRRSSEERMRGYQLALEKFGLEARDDYIQFGDYTAGPERWRESTLQLLALSPRPTAIISSDDIVAATALKTAQNAGLQVPRDIAIVGIDDQPFCTYLNPALTTVQLPIIETGRRAIEILRNRIIGESKVAEHIVLPCPLIVRESSLAIN